jgi:hypothetical protein
VSDDGPAQATKLGAHFGHCQGKTAFAKETSEGSWQVQLHDPMHRHAGHDGWLTIGTGWPTLAAACAETGLR